MPLVKLTADQVQEIRDARNSRHGKKRGVWSRFARRFGVDRGTISKVRHYKTWL